MSPRPALAVAAVPVSVSGHLPKMIGAAEVAEALGVSRSLVFKLHRTHAMRGVKIGNRLVFDSDTVIAFIEKCRQESAL